MGLKRTYQLICDDCGTGGNMQADSPRHARAIAKRDGWGRIKVIVGQAWYPDSDEPGGRHYYDDIRGRDFCPKCVDRIAEDVL
jgi:hypothetical protein